VRIQIVQEIKWRCERKSETHVFDPFTHQHSNYICLFRSLCNSFRQCELWIVRHDNSVTHLIMSEYLLTFLNRWSISCNNEIIFSSLATLNSLIELIRQMYVDIYIGSLFNLHKFIYWSIHFSNELLGIIIINDFSAHSRTHTCRHAWVFASLTFMIINPKTFIRLSCGIFTLHSL
jgi:hypothetical protein